jgi:hypothetical protein
MPRVTAVDASFVCRPVRGRRCETERHDVELSGGGVTESHGQHQTGASHSFDGHWWWDGQAWLSAYSPDQRWWWKEADPVSRT